MPNLSSKISKNVNQKVELAKFYLLINHELTTIISTKFNDQENAMTASWVCPLDYDPIPKLTLVLSDKSFTRSLLLKSGYFAVQVPVSTQAEMVMRLGKSSGADDTNKIANCGGKVFYEAGFDVPLIAGCAGWIIYKLLPNEANQREHGLFIGEVVAAFSDERVICKRTLEI